MLKIISKLSGRNYQPLNQILVSKGNLAYNYKYLSSLNSEIKVAPVLKSNAYGHGLKIISEFIDELNAPFICVDSLYEAYELMKKNVRTKILIMGSVDSKSLATKKLPFSFAVSSNEILDALIKFQPEAKVHIFVDTGMHREGIDILELEEFVARIQETDLEVEGLMSHLAMSDKSSDSLTQKQIENFAKAKILLETNGINPKWIHISNSSALLNNQKYGKKLGNLARVGLAFYGINPEFSDKNLRPAMSLITHIAQIKNIKKGEKVGYDFTFTAEKNMELALLPIGYFDGVDRRLSNKGFVKIGDDFARIIGRVSMNITIVDVSEIENLKIGDEVVVFSNRSIDKNSFENSAKIINSISYDPLVHIDSSIRRELVD